ncbi:MAG: sterol desaturase family protein [Balneolaceae bacterium]|nr:sterol desaturase family protein [Balneolaceae bacterium]
MPANWITFAALFVLYDLCFYWDHRMSHQVSLFWGGHVVHHQSEDFNLSVALRQSSTDFIWSFPFYLPLAVLGFQPVQFVLVAGLNLLYQFWIHTEHIDKLGWFEKIMNTPSHHRVHHGRDPKYIDQNYAGVFIIWDKMFGTFTEEEERPTYGITKPVNSWNPLYVNFAHYIDLYKQVRESESWKDTGNMLLRHPGWMPEYLGGPQKPGAVSEDFQKYNENIAFTGGKLYIFFQFVVTMLIVAYFLFNYGSFNLATKGLFAGWIIYSTVMFGLLFESNSKTLIAIESMRLLCIPAGIWWLASQSLI